MRIILDTNIWISSLISKEFQWIDTLFASNAHQLIFSDQLLTEFLHVAKRPKLKKFISEAKLKRLIEQFDIYAMMIDTTSKIELCRDPNDNFLLELAVDGNADFLVTGDNDLLSLRIIGGCKIITVAQLKAKLA